VKGGLTKHRKKKGNYVRVKEMARSLRGVGREESKQRLIRGCLFVMSQGADPGVGTDRERRGVRWVRCQRRGDGSSENM